MASILQAMWPFGSTSKAQKQELFRTQIIYLDINPEIKLDVGGTKDGQTWSTILDIIEKTSGFRRLYWGRRLEEPENVQLHIVRDTMQQHRQFLASHIYKNQILPKLQALSQGSDAEYTSSSIFTRHASLRDFTEESLALGRGLPTLPVGTAIYLDTDDAWTDGAWPLWTHVVRYVKGCRGVSGGSLVEDIEGHKNNYLVYVAWAAVKDHDDYHHTEHFAKHKVILRLGNKGWREYGHVMFHGGRGKGDRSSKL